MKKLPPLREWQKSAFDKWRANNFKGTFEVATGGGKTTFALHCFDELLRIKSDLRCLVIVPTTALLDQWFIGFTDDLGILEEDIKILSTRDLDPSALVNICIINTARSFRNYYSDSTNLLLIVDECHRAGSQENSRSLIRDSYATIGLSATPHRDFDEGFNEFVQPILGEILTKYTLEDAITDGVLSELSLTYVKIPMTEDEQSEYDSLTSKIGRAFRADANQETLETLLRKRARVYNNAVYRIPVMARIMASHKGKRALIFVESIKTANESKRLLDSMGLSVAIYHSELSSHLRRSNLRSFRRGIYDVLVACRALDEGFNVPEAELAIIAAGTSSKRQRIQRVGRVLRSLTGKNLGEVITLYATPVEEQRLLVEAESMSQHATIRWVEAKND